MTPSPLTVILPCAGAGSRLGVPGPKELLEIAPPTRLIDLTLAHLRAAVGFNRNLEVAVVIDAGKEAVFEYVRSRLPGIPVHKVCFDHRFREWPGSVHSAARFCRTHSLVLLPDSIMFLSRNDPLHDEAGRTVAEAATVALRDHSLAFGVVKCADPMRLSSLGALHVKRGEVRDLADKPRAGFSRFNSAWGCFAFRCEVEADLFAFLDRSVAREEPELAVQPFHPAAAFPLAFYADLGTPDGLTRNRGVLKRFLKLIPEPRDSAGEHVIPGLSTR